MAQRTDIDEIGLRQLVDAFYARVRADKLIGPLFNGAIDDWLGDLTRLADFWGAAGAGARTLSRADHAGHVRPLARLVGGNHERADDARSGAYVARQGRPHCRKLEPRPVLQAIAFPDRPQAGPISRSIVMSVLPVETQPAPYPAHAKDIRLAA
ncbi:hypothetical protein sphantq_00617 [Sphingobium sp. AntQ-1]|nr:hypothetical protein sphantq_00617 [Sphingobium sp. AntQ-1]